MVNSHKPVDIDWRIVVSELTSEGVLPTDTSDYAQKMIARNNEAHTWCGLIDYTQSSYLMKRIDDLNIPVDRAAVFVNKPQVLTGWHIDGPSVQVAINIPWFGDELTVTEFREKTSLPSEERPVYNENGSIRRIELINKSWPATSSFIMNHTALVNVGMYHRINSMKSLTPRGLISLRFKPYVYYEDLVSYL